MVIGGKKMAKQKPKGNKYDAPFMNITKEMIRKVDGQHTPKKRETKKSK